ncbi:MAG TPA: type II secretion system protein GspL [Nevskiaceae bacterium]|nr:type II secretion system protein GspL [Nevskiaceae bacterium]
MRETLYIRWRDDARQALHYALVSAEAPGSIVVESAPMDDVLALASGRRVVLFVPGGAVHLANAQVPTRQASKVLQAIPYELEDQLAEDVETLHFAIGAREADGSYPVAVVARGEMDQWLAPLRKHGADVDAVVPETLCLPPPLSDGGWPVLVEPDQVTVRSGAYAGFSCTREDLPVFLEIAEHGNGPQALRALLCDAVGGDFDVPGHRVELLPGYRDPLQALIQHYAPATSLNLLQGAYSRHESLQRLWRPWRLAAALLVAVFAVAWLTNLIGAVRLGEAATAQQAHNVQRFHQLFPNQPTSLALALAIQQVAATHGSGDGAAGNLLQLLKPTAEALDTMHGFTVQEIQYRDHALYAQLSGTQLQSLDKLRDWFAAHKQVRLHVENANATGNDVQVNIKVSAR